jgi:hypothetical protein
VVPASGRDHTSRPERATSNSGLAQAPGDPRRVERLVARDEHIAGEDDLVHRAGSDLAQHADDGVIPRVTAHASTHRELGRLQGHRCGRVRDRFEIGHPRPTRCGPTDNRGRDDHLTRGARIERQRAHRDDPGSRFVDRVVDRKRGEGAVDVVDRDARDDSGGDETDPVVQPREPVGPECVERVDVIRQVPGASDDLGSNGGVGHAVPSDRARVPVSSWTAPPIIVCRSTEPNPAARSWPINAGPDGR